MATGASIAAVPGMSGFLAEAEHYEVARTTATGALIQGSSGPENELHGVTVAASRSRDAASTSYARSSPELTQMDNNSDVADVASLTKAVKVGERLAEDAGRVRSALAGGAPAASVFGGQEYVKPANGTFTSGFGGRWGTTHYGIDLANKIGTPIYAVTDGTVISSGPASGFGMWVRLQHPGGWISVYGHINRSLVRVGQKVKAGEQIAEIGNRGQSTGPHLHFEIWDPSGKKLNPLPWLAARGIRVTGSSTAD
ncbi:MAG TPA: M23 family metallopeptidase [Pseudonocardia sp.]